MAKRFIDISAGLKAGIASDPPPMLPKIANDDEIAETLAVDIFFDAGDADFPD